MDTETQAVHELLEISYQTTKYTYRFISALFKHGSHGAAALAGLIQSALNGSGKKSGLANMKAILKHSNGITGFTLDRNDFEVFRQQANEMQILYAAVAAETNPELLTIITGSEHAALVNQIINVNNLNGVMLGTLEQAKPPVTAETPEQSDVLNEDAEHPAKAPDSASETAAESAGFFSEFDEQDEPEVSPPPAPVQDKERDSFFEAFAEEPESPEYEVTALPKQESQMPPEGRPQYDNGAIYEVEFTEVTASDLQAQPENVRQSLQIAGYLPSSIEKENPTRPDQIQGYLSGNESPGTNGKSGIPLTDNRISVRDRVAEIKKSGKPEDAPITSKVRELMKDTKGVAI